MKIRAFARDKWNLVNILGNCLILIGILMHMSDLESGLLWAKALYGVATTLCTLQALEFLNASSSTAEFTALIVKTVVHAHQCTLRVRTRTVRSPAQLYPDDFIPTCASCFFLVVCQVTFAQSIILL